MENTSTQYMDGTPRRTSFFADLWKYLRYESTNIFSSYGISLLIFCLVPVILVLFYALVQPGRILSGDVNFPEIDARTSCFALVMICFGIHFPVKFYGTLTEKKSGSSYLMVPASRAVKITSMLLLSLVIMPLVFLFGYLLVDWIVCLVFPRSGSAIIASSLIPDDTTNIDMFTGSAFFMYLWLVHVIVAFLYGAVLFRRHKVSRTILCLVGLSIIFLFIGSGLARLGLFDTLEDFFDNHMEYLENMDTGSVVMWAKVAIASYLVVWTAVFATLTGFRLRNLKH